MKYESAKTEKGNVGVSYESQEAADLQAEQMDENGNTNCYSCSDCYRCSGCSHCSSCSETLGALRWMGAEAKNLLSINGLRWPVSTDGKSIQIGCQHHSVELWANFGDGEISCMAEESLDFWHAFKDLVLVLAKTRADMEG